MKKIIQIFRFEKWNNYHKIFSKINTIQNHHHQIVSLIEWREKSRSQSVLNRRKKKSKNSIDQISFISIDQNDFEIIESLNASNIELSAVQSIKRDRERSKKFSIQINFVIQSNICFLMNNFDFIFDDFFDDVRDYSNHFLIKISFQFIVSKQKKIDELLKKKFSNSSTSAKSFKTQKFSTHVS